MSKFDKSARSAWLVTDLLTTAKMLLNRMIFQEVSKYMVLNEVKTAFHRHAGWSAKDNPKASNIIPSLTINQTVKTAGLL